MSTHSHMRLTLIKLATIGRSRKNAMSAGIWYSKWSTSNEGIRSLYSSVLKWLDINPPNWTSVSIHCEIHQNVTYTWRYRHMQIPHTHTHTDTDTHVQSLQTHIHYLIREMASYKEYIHHVGLQTKIQSGAWCKITGQQIHWFIHN